MPDAAQRRNHQQWRRPHRSGGRGGPARAVVVRVTAARRQTLEEASVLVFRTGAGRRVRLAQLVNDGRARVLRQFAPESEKYTNVISTVSKLSRCWMFGIILPCRHRRYCCVDGSSFWSAPFLHPIGFARSTRANNSVSLCAPQCGHMHF